VTISAARFEINSQLRRLIYMLIKSLLHAGEIAITSALFSHVHSLAAWMVEKVFFSPGKTLL